MFDLFKKKNHGKISAIVVAAGNSSRMNMADSKQFIDIFGKPVIAYSLEALQNTPQIDEIIIVTREQDILMVSDIVLEYGILKTTNVISGGNTRHESVKIGLGFVTDADLVVIHDGARPCILSNQIQSVISSAYEYGAAALGCKAVDTLKMVNEDGIICSTIDRSNVWQIQTPQVFNCDLIKKAYENADDPNATDDCILLENMGVKVFVVEGSSANIKVTTPNDIYIAKAIIESRMDG